MIYYSQINTLKSKKIYFQKHEQSFQTFQKPDTLSNFLRQGRKNSATQETT